MIKDTHHEETEAPEAEAEAGTRHHDALSAPPTSQYPNVILVNGARYGCLDPTAGIRVYSDGRGNYKSWIGGIDLAAVDTFTGLTLANEVIRANQQESKAFFSAVRKCRNVLGGYPSAITTDRGLSITRLFAFAARKRIDFVVPFRRPHAVIEDEQDMRTAEFDEHTPRCRYCGGPAQRRVHAWGSDREEAAHGSTTSASSN